MNIPGKIMSAFTFPLKFDPSSGYFFDQHNQMVAMIRGWGHLEKHFDQIEANQIQCELGEMIATAFNEKYCK